MPKKFTEKQVNAAIAELDKVRRQWLRRPGVTAVDVGYKISSDKITDELAIRVHVQRKLPPEALPGYEVFNSPDAPQTLGGFPIDVIEAEYGPSLTPFEIVDAEAVDRKSQVDPLVGGVSVGHPNCTAGTIGAIVYDKSDGSACILSNWHVLKVSPAGAVGDPIYQPGPYDGGTAADTVATLKRWRLDPDMDAALAQLTGARSFSRDILGLTPIVGIDQPALGMNVVKSGRTTAVTRGIIDGLSLSVTINYRNGVVQTLNNQIHIVPRPPWPAVDYELSMGGDSGSVWINEANNKAVGLHFAGETNPAPASEHAIASPMVKVAEVLNFQFDPVYVICIPLISPCRFRILCYQEMICKPSLLCAKLVLCPKEGLCVKELSPVNLTKPIETQSLAGNRYAVIDMASLSPDMRRAVEHMLAAIAACEED